jgi:hypothetical protein
MVSDLHGREITLAHRPGQLNYREIVNFGHVTEP